MKATEMEWRMDVPRQAVFRIGLGDTHTTSIGSRTPLDPQLLMGAGTVCHEPTEKMRLARSESSLGYFIRPYRVMTQSFRSSRRGGIVPVIRSP